MIGLITAIATYMAQAPTPAFDADLNVRLVRAENVVAADVASLCAQVKNKQALQVTYAYDPATADARTFMPYAVGYTRAREMMVFGLQTAGYSRSASLGQNELPGWRNLRTDQITMIEKDGAEFRAQRPQPSDLRAISQFACRNDLAMGAVQ